MTTTVDPKRKQLAAIFRVCAVFDLGRGERIELATILFDRNVESYNDLTLGELSRLRDALDGARIVCTIQMERKRGTRR